MAALLSAVFTASAGFGVLLPVLPQLVERLLGAGAEAAQVSRHAGLLTAAYSFALFIFAPAWGWLSDRRGRRGVLLTGLLGLAASMLGFLLADSLAALYAERFVSGMFASALTPVAAAAISELPGTDHERARRLAFVSMAGIAGFLLGPMLGGIIARVLADFVAERAGAAAMPLAAAALLVAIAVAFAVPGGPGGRRSVSGISTARRDKSRRLVPARPMPALLVLAFIVAAGIGVFDIGLALRGRQELALTPLQVALMFAACGLVMLLMQSIVFSRWVRPQATRWLIAPALTVLAAGLFLLPRASDLPLTLAVIGGVAASAGILQPILTYWISAKAGSAQGWELGKQAAAVSLGVTLGSAAGGLLFDVPGIPGASFALTAGLAVLGALLSLRLPKLLRQDRAPA